MQPAQFGYAAAQLSMCNSCARLLLCVGAVCVAVVGAVTPAYASADSSAQERWVAPQGLPKGHNGGHLERLTAPSAGKRPHVVVLLMDDYGWSEAGWHRNYSIGNVTVPPTTEVRTPALDALVREGIELNRAYSYKCCSPTRSALQSGRHPYRVNALNSAAEISNRSDPVSGFAGIPRNMTGIATKMAAAGYRTSFYGKWDVGMATPDHTPRGRGYHQSLHYFHHDNDYWSQAYQLRCNRTTLTDLWETDAGDVGGVGGPARGINNTCSGMSPPGPEPAACAPGPRAAAGAAAWGGYEDALFEAEVLRTIQSHDASDAAAPLFLVWAPHIAHAPLQAPARFIDEFAFIKPTDQAGSQRQLYHAMVAFADAAVANVTAALKAKGMWDDTLVVMLADNGGWVSKNGTAGGNNYPLVGGKYNNWEGGIRVNSFVSGGFVPAARRGSRYDGLVTAWDWYRTLASLAGVDATDARAARAGLPPVGGFDLSGIITGSNMTRPRTALLLGTEPAESNLSTAPLCSAYGKLAPVLYDDSAAYAAAPAAAAPRGARCATVDGVIVDDGAGRLWKLLLGQQKQYARTGPRYPNASTDFDSQASAYTRDCANGCLYELESDPLETTDLARAPGAQRYASRLASMRSRIEEALPGAFNPHRGNVDPGACKQALRMGYWGPWLD